MSQPLLICCILEFLSLDEHETKGHDSPVGKPLLNRDLNGEPRKHLWLYCGAVGMLNYLGNSIQPEIQMAVHQTACFSVNPMRLHKLAIMRIGCYLCNICEQGIIYKVDKLKGIEVYVDTDFAGGWSSANADNADNVLSQTGFVICYANCSSCGAANFRLKLHFQLLRSSTLPCLMLFVIPFQSRTSSKRFAAPDPITIFCITVHEENLSAISMAKSLKFTPYKKHIAIKHHHFCSRVQTSSNNSSDIKLKYISTTQQLADILTKPVINDVFFKL
jgi:hypothetical protein